MQPFDALPEELPLYPLENALLPGGELPLELSRPEELTMFLDVLKTDQLVGLVQPKGSAGELYPVGCAGRIRQYRERKDGRLNIMLTGLCRYRILEELPATSGYRRARVDWQAYRNDYLSEDVLPEVIAEFRESLKNYFDAHNMQADWKVLDKLHIEQVVNNLVLVMNLDVASKQELLESPDVQQRVTLFTRMLDETDSPVLAPNPQGARLN